MAKFTKATRGQVIAANDLLRQHLKAIEGTSMFAYDGEWSDAKIAEAVGGINADQVANVRLEIFGPLIDRKAPSAEGADVALLRAQVAEMQRAMLAQAEAHTKLADLHTKLCVLLSVNQIVDARHLSGKPSLSPPVVNGAPAREHYPAGARQ